MKILALDSCAVSASCCVFEDGRILAQALTNVKLTHSQTLLPMVADMLKNAELTMADIDALACSAGPGSFTGVRIGVSAVKGLALPNDLPTAPVSSLAAIAETACGAPFGGVICAVMDARCQQVYTACFSCEKGQAERLTPDEALSVAELSVRLLKMKKPVLFVGDGAELCCRSLGNVLPCLIAPPHARYATAWGVAAVAAREQRFASAKQLQPCYLRLSQAERELKARQANE